MKKLCIIGLSIILVFIVGYVFYYDKQEKKVVNNPAAEQKLSYITIDINPSIELAVDEKDIVVEAITLNEDADVIYSDLDLTGKSVDEATEIIVDTAIETGYIAETSDTNSVNVTSYSENETKRDRLNKKIIDKLNAHFETRKIYALVVQNGLDDELKTKADLYNISYGKMLLVNRAITLNSSLKESDLALLSVKEIQEKIKVQAIARREEIKKTYQEAKKEFKDIKEQKIIEAREKLKNDKEELLKSAGDPSKLTTEQKQILIDQRKEQIKEEIKNVRKYLEESKTTINEQVKQEIKDKYILKKK